MACNITIDSDSVRGVLREDHSIDRIVVTGTFGDCSHVKVKIRYSGEDTTDVEAIILGRVWRAELIAGEHFNVNRNFIRCGINCAIEAFCVEDSKCSTSLIIASIPCCPRFSLVVINARTGVIEPDPRGNCLPAVQYRVALSPDTDLPEGSYIQEWDVDNDRLPGQTQREILYTLPDDGNMHTISVILNGPGECSLPLTMPLRSCTPHPPIKRYRCSGNPDYQCIEDPNGGYATLEACQEACQAPPPTKRYRCSGSPDYQCIEDPNGGYATLEACQEACQARYKCSGSPDYKCIEDPNGGYATLEACQEACQAPPLPKRYRCTGNPDYQCIEDPNGRYATLEECQAACKATTNGKNIFDICFLLMILMLLGAGLFAFGFLLAMCPIFVSPLITDMRIVYSLAVALIVLGFVMFLVSLILWYIICRPSFCNWVALAWKVLFIMGMVTTYYMFCSPCAPLGLFSAALMLLGAFFIWLYWIRECNPDMCTIFNSFVVLLPALDMLTIFEILLGWCVITNNLIGAFFWGGLVVAINSLAVLGQQHYCNLPWRRG